MNTAWMLMLACEGPVALPPKVHRPVPSSSRMVQMTHFRGFLHRPLQSMDTVAVLKIVDTLDENERDGAKAFPHQVVLIIERDQDAKVAHEYLKGLAGITSVNTICTDPCPSLMDAQ